MVMVLRSRFCCETMLRVSATSSGVIGIGSYFRAARGRKLRGASRARVQTIKSFAHEKSIRLAARRVVTASLRLAPPKRTLAGNIYACTFINL